MILEVRLLLNQDVLNSYLVELSVQTHTLSRVRITGDYLHQLQPQKLVCLHRLYVPLHLNF